MIASVASGSRRTSERKVLDMTANDRLVLFAVSMTMVVLVALIMWLYQIAELRRLRKTLTTENVVKKMCSGRYFDLERLLRVYGISTMTYHVSHGELYYTATIGGKHSQIRLTLGKVDNYFELVRVERYRDMNWQFAGWYNGYLRKDDATEADYLVVGAGNVEEADAKHRLPGFYLTRKAIEQLFAECIAR